MPHMTQITAAWFLLSMGLLSILLATLFYRPYRSLWLWVLNWVKSQRLQTDDASNDESGYNVRCLHFLLWFFSTNAWRWTLVVCGTYLILLALPIILK